MESQQPDQAVLDFVHQAFNNEYLEGLKEFVRIPSLAPLFDPEWQTNGHLYRQCDHLVNFAKSQDLKGVNITALKDEGKSPFLIVNVEPTDPTSESCVLLYGHMDKQPFGEGWKTEPTDPVIQPDEKGVLKLYGRGSSDDGYAFFSALLAIKACQANGRAHPRCIITIEGSEEGEIDDLLYYIQNYKHLMGKPQLVICLDSEANMRDRLSITTTLRGYLDFTLSVRVADNNIHSGVGSGIVPNPFQIMITLLQRLEDFKTQRMIDELQVKVPEHRIDELQKTSELMPPLDEDLPKLGCVHNLAHKFGDKEKYQLFINNFWSPSLSVIGFEGLPTIEKAGNVLYQELRCKVSLRLPPTLSGEEAAKVVSAKILEERPETFGAKIDFQITSTGNGLDAPKLPDDIHKKFLEAHTVVFGGNEPISVGCGGSIPFMEIFSSNFPGTNFLLTGVGFADANAHAANENLDLEFCERLVQVIALTLTRL
ncbi:peptidase m20 [Stylonychia lemnae]|uniref:Peptidase m20 n=1 Tax=Stylonychia lemnae TaxID=5949 RepID=A0A078A0R3_STYLE|nr:peptidase m20 [Stylonychia lemnae]|eukprot:CDW75791.1 peptidase m20 [Stylonychia lemnae]